MWGIAFCSFLFCFYVWPYMLNVDLFNSYLVNIFSIAVHIIYSEKYGLYLGKFWSRIWSVPGPLSRFPLIAKRCAGETRLHHNVLAPHISKTHLPFSSLNIHELKRPVKENGKPQLPPQNVNPIWHGLFWSTTVRGWTNHTPLPKIWSA